MVDHNREEAGNEDPRPASSPAGADDLGVNMGRDGVASILALNPSPLNGDEDDRMIQIADLIKDLQEVEERFGNTCVYIRRGGMSWGGVALNRRADDQMNGVFDLQAQHDRDILARLQQIERLRSRISYLESEKTDPALVGIADVMKESGGGWRPCTGCYDTEDGHPTARYDDSPALKTAIGSGCHECGGLGARWEYYSDQDIADMLADEDALAATEAGQ